MIVADQTGGSTFVDAFRFMGDNVHLLLTKTVEHLELSLAERVGQGLLRLDGCLRPFEEPMDLPLHRRACGVSGHVSQERQHRLAPVQEEPNVAVRLGRIGEGTAQRGHRL